MLYRALYRSNQLPEIPDLYPNWLKLLLHHQQTRGFGLTLPFLVGALQSSQQTQADRVSCDRAGLKRLLEMMRDTTPDGFYVRIAECDRVRNPVVFPSSGWNGFDRRLRSRLLGRFTVFLSRKYFEMPVRGVNSVVHCFWAIYASAIEEQRFSYRNGQFGKFDNADTSFIVEALSMFDDE